MMEGSELTEEVSGCGREAPSPVFCARKGSEAEAEAEAAYLRETLDHVVGEGKRMERIAKEQYTLRMETEEENKVLKQKMAALMRELDKKNTRSYSPPVMEGSKRAERHALSDGKRLRAELLSCQKKLTIASAELGRLQSQVTELKCNHDQQIISIRSASASVVSEKTRELKKKLEVSEACSKSNSESLATAVNCLTSALSKLGVESVDPSLEGLCENLIAETLKPVPYHSHPHPRHSHSHPRSESPYLPDNEVSSVSPSTSEGTLPISHRSPPPPVRSSLPSWSRSRESCSPPSWSSHQL